MIALYDNAERIVACVNQSGRTSKLELVNYIEKQLRQLKAGGWPAIHGGSTAEYAEYTDKLLEHLQKGWILVKKKWAQLETRLARGHFVSRVFDQDAGYAHLVGTLEDYKAPDPSAVLAALTNWLRGVVWANPFIPKKIENVHLRRIDCIERDWAELSNPQSSGYETLWQGMLYKIAENLGMQLEQMPGVVRQEYRQILKQALSSVNGSGAVIDALLDTRGRLEYLCGIEELRV